MTSSTNTEADSEDRHNDVDWHLSENDLAWVHWVHNQLYDVANSGSCSSIQAGEISIAVKDLTAKKCFSDVILDGLDHAMIALLEKAPSHMESWNLEAVKIERIRAKKDEAYQSYTWYNMLIYRESWNACFTFLEVAKVVNVRLHAFERFIHQCKQFLHLIPHCCNIPIQSSQDHPPPHQKEIYPLDTLSELLLDISSHNNFA